MRAVKVAQPRTLVTRLGLHLSAGALQPLLCLRLIWSCHQRMPPQVHLVLDAAWQYQLCSGSSIYPNPAGMDGDQGCARLPSLLGLLLGRMLPAVVILLFVLFSLTLVCEDQRDQVVELGAAAVAAREQEAWQAAMGTANGRSSGSGLGNSTSTVDSFRQRRGLGAGLQALWQLPDDFMRLLWRVRFSVKALWHHTLSEDVIKCALWPLMAVVVSLQVRLTQP